MPAKDAADLPDSSSAANADGDPGATVSAGEEARQSIPIGSAKSPKGDGEDASLRERFEAAISERDENYDKWMRAQAELDNYRKRVRKEAEENRLYHAVPIVRELLPGLDNLQRAIDAAENSQSVSELIDGVRMVARQFDGILAGQAVVPIDALGKAFDPNLHEAVQQIPSDEEPLTIVEEIERGYMIHERVVRPSKVIVSSGPPEASGKASAGEST